MAAKGLDACFELHALAFSKIVIRQKIHLANADGVFLQERSQRMQMLGRIVARWNDRAAHDNVAVRFVGYVTEVFKAAVYEEIRYLMAMANERINVELIAERDLFPDVFRSSLMRDGVKTGKDMYNRRFKFENGAVLGAAGGVDII